MPVRPEELLLIEHKAIKVPAHIDITLPLGVHGMFMRLFNTMRDVTDDTLTTGL